MIKAVFHHSAGSAQNTIVCNLKKIKHKTDNRCTYPYCDEKIKKVIR